MRDIPELYKDLSLNDDYEVEKFISDIIDVMTSAEVDEGFEDGKKGFTYAEVRNLLEAHYDQAYDQAYDPEDRNLERKPTQREVNFGLEVMLSATDWDNLVVREKDGLIYMISDAEREAVDNAKHEAEYPKDEDFRRAQSSP